MRKRKMITFRGETKWATEWADIMGIPPRHAILAAHPRLQRGGGLDDARQGEKAGGEKAEAQAVH